MSQKRSIEERADRWLRRYTGPWQTLNNEIGPVQVTWRRRYRPKVEWVRLWVAWHDLTVHGLSRGLLIPAMRTIQRRLSKSGGSGGETR